MINNDKKNSLVKTITSIAQRQIEKEDILGIYLKAYKENHQDKIEIVSVVEGISEEWESLWENQGYQTQLLAKIHNIKIYPTVITIASFSKVLMHFREVLTAQELKNSYIIYDVEPTREDSSKKLLADLQESYMQDEDLTFYKNRIEISPKLIKKIKAGLKYGKPIQLSREIKSHIHDKEALTTEHKIYQILDLLTWYEGFEKEDGYPYWNHETSDFDLKYIVCDDENFERFKKMQEKTKASNYSLKQVFMDMKTSPTPTSREERKAFFGKCLSYLVDGFESINPLDYLEGEEATYQELWIGKKPKRK